MKKTDILQAATSKVEVDFRANYVYGNIYLADLIDCYQTQLLSHSQKAGIYKHSHKQNVNSLSKIMIKYRRHMQSGMSAEFYEAIGVFLDNLHEHLEDNIKILFYSVKRQVDKHISDSDLSYVVCDLAMINIMSDFELKRTHRYAQAIETASGTFMQAIYDAKIIAIHNTSKKMIAGMITGGLGSLLNDEIQRAFDTFAYNLNTFKMDFSTIKTTQSA